MHKLTAASPRKTSSPNSLRFCLNRISVSQVLATVTNSAQLYFANKKSCHPSIINEKRMTLARRSNANQPRRWSTVLPCLGGADSGTNATKLKSVSTSGPEVKTNPSNWHSEIFTKVKYFVGHFFSEGQKWDGRVSGVCLDQSWRNAMSQVGNMYEEIISKQQPPMPLSCLRWSKGPSRPGNFWEVWKFKKCFHQEDVSNLNDGKNCVTFWLSWDFLLSNLKEKHVFFPTLIVLRQILHDTTCYAIVLLLRSCLYL